MEPEPQLSPAPPDSLRVRRQPERARYDADTVHAILDATPLCTVASIDDAGRPIGIPTLHARIDDVLYLHGSTASGNLRRLSAGLEVCVTVMLLDGLVLAHRVFNHSVNYRSVVVRGVATSVTDDDEKLRALRAFTEQVLPDRWDEALPPDDQELKATAVLRVPLDEASAKLRTGWPGHVDEYDDLTSIWVGVIPVSQVAGSPQPHPDIPDDVPVSPAALAWSRVHAAIPE